MFIVVCAQLYISLHNIYRVAQKVSHYQVIKISYEIVLKRANEIRFIRLIKVSIKHSIC